MLVGIFLKEVYDCLLNRGICFRICSNHGDIVDYLSKRSNKSESTIHTSQINVFRGYPLCGGMKFLNSTENMPEERYNVNYIFKKKIFYKNY